MEKINKGKEQYRKTRVVVVIKTKDEINRIVKEIQKKNRFLWSSFSKKRKKT